jgi:hypothetical protein
MRIIREKNGDVSLSMLAEFTDYGVSRCNVSGCHETPSTLILDMQPNWPPIGMCETHFQEATQPGGASFKFEFNNFNAFKRDEE